MRHAEQHARMIRLDAIRAGRDRGGVQVGDGLGMGKTRAAAQQAGCERAGDEEMFHVLSFVWCCGSGSQGGDVALRIGQGRSTGFGAHGNAFGANDGDVGQPDKAEC